MSILTKYYEKFAFINHIGFWLPVPYNEESERTYGSVQDALEYRFGTKMRKDIISDMDVIERSF